MQANSRFSLRANARCTSASEQSVNALFSQSRLHKKLLSAAIASVCVLGHTGAALAAGKTLVLEEVVVTATKQEETLNNVGASILAAGSKQIDDMGFRDMSSLVSSMPNVNVQQAPTGTRLTIRGVGTVPSGGTSSSVATFIDGVYQGNSSQTNNILVDMQRVEVLRGPQGTLFGKNSISGVMNLISARPTQQFEGLVDVRAGNLDSHEGTVVLSGGLTDSLSARFVAYKQHTGDYIKNTTGPGGAGGGDKESYRLSFNWDASDNTSVWLKYQHDHNQTNAAVYELTGLADADAQNLANKNPALFARTDTKLNGRYAAGVTTQFGVDTGLNRNSTLTGTRDLLAASFNHTFDNEYELSATFGYDRNKVFNRGSNSQNYPFLTIYLDTDTNYETKNVDIRLSSPTTDRFRFTVGAYAEKSKFGIDSGSGYINFDYLASFIAPGMEALLTPAFITNLGAPYGWNNTTSLAGYAQAAFDFTDELTLTVGLRYSDDKIVQEKDFDERTDLNGNPLLSASSFEALGLSASDAAALSYAAQQYIFLPDPPNGVGVGIPGMDYYKETHHDRAVLPAGKLEYRPNPDALYYASIQTGYKNGGFSTDGLKYPEPFDKEKSTAYEMGGKWTLANGRGQFGAAIFHTDFKNFQVANIDPTSGGVKFSNAAEAYSEGIELDTRWKLTEEISVSAQYAYLQAKYRSFDNAPASVSQGVAGLSGQDLAHKPLSNAPTNSGSVSVDYVQPLAGSLQFQSNLLVSLSDSMYTDLANSDELKAHSTVLVDLRLALADTANQWTVALIGHNLTNDRTQMFGTTNSLLNAGTYFGAIRPPASYWIQLEKRF